MLHGHPGNEEGAAVYSTFDSTSYPDPLATYDPHNDVHQVGDFHCDITQWNDWPTHSQTADHKDSIGFSSTVYPDLGIENGLYQGHSGRPWQGTHIHIENRQLTPSGQSFGEVAGAMGWSLGSLDPGQSVSHTVALMFGAQPVVCPSLIPADHWGFDEGGYGAGAYPTVYDSVGGHNGTMTNMDPASDRIPGVINSGEALDFDGVNDCVDLPGALDVLAADSVTISAWVKPAAALSGEAFYPIVTQFNGLAGYYLSLYGYYPDFYLNDNCRVTSDSSIDTAWHWLVGTYDGVYMKLYIDGVLAKSALSPDHSGVSADAYIGGSPSGQTFKGTIDSVWVQECPWDPTIDCYPTCREYAQWFDAGRPSCWCGSGRQCHGDADGLQQGSPKTGYTYVGTNDLNILIAAWQVKEPPFGNGIASVANGICADFTHDIGGNDKTGFYRVGTSDLNILITYWLIKEPPDGLGIPPNCLQCGRGQQMARGEVDYTRIVKWIESIWRDPEIQKAINMEGWIRLIKSIEQYLADSLSSAQ